MAKKSTLSERGKFKIEITSALYKNKDIREMICGDTTGKSTSEIAKEFKNYVKSHLFIDDTITETKTYIFYDVIFTSLHTQTKECNVIMYLICHRDILDDYAKEGYYGNRTDALSQMVVDSLINDKETANSFGIGELTLDSVDVYNSQRMYGCELRFSVPSFK